MLIKSNDWFWFHCLIEWQKLTIVEDSDIQRLVQTEQELVLPKFAKEQENI